MWLYFLILLFINGVFLYVYLGKIYQFWINLKVPHTKPRFPLGDIQRGGWSENFGVLLQKFYHEFEGERFFGIWMLTNPVLVIRDPELIKSIFVKDFAYFQNRGVYYNEKADPLSAHLFSIEGLKWKNLRNKLSPTFTSGKMKLMFPLVIKCSEELKEHLKKPAENKECIDIKEVTAMFMTDVISLCAFGIDTNSLKNPDAEFRKMGKKVNEPSLRTFILMYLQLTAPKIAHFFGLRVFPKDSSNFFMKAVKDVMDYREKNKIQRNDFMELLISLKNYGILNDNKNIDENSSEFEEKLSFEDVAAQAFVFFLAGFETSSSTTQFALFELAKYPDIQQKLRTEISNTLAKYEGKLTYESIFDIPLLDKVIDETLRKYPVVPSLQRECNKNYKIPGSDVVIPKGTLVQIPIYAIQMDEKYFPDPERFDPERFSEEEKQKRHHYAYLPFGEGPRNCIGKRFGQMQVRVALTVLLLSYKFELSKNQDGPLKFDPKVFVITPREPLNLKISPL